MKTSSPPVAQSSSSAAHAPELRADPDAGLTNKQLRSLYEKLRSEESRLAEEIKRNIQEAVTEAERHADEGDQASQNANQAYLLRYADKQNKLLQQVRRALQKMQTGEYGICEGSGEPIGVQRLNLRPWTRYSVEYKEQMDRDKRRR
ncbi:TraR/DksA family transcriptional regulator [Haliangium sp.]|uniref:TraR/DksA family transcriptional regulator n=1 Tax=Haliangium sp. TaxID=2663208 RepID=UPI003D10C4F5